MDEINYYSILQVDPTASIDEVRVAYRRLAFQYHPDQSPDPDATRKMQALNAAYDVLGNLEKRLEYDRQRLSPPVTPAPQAQPQPTAAPTPGPAPEARPGNGAQPKPEPPAAAAPAPPPVDPVILEKRRRRRQKRLRTQLKVIAVFTLLTFVLFIASLITGKISVGVIVILVLMIAYILGVFISRIRSIRLER